MTMTRKLFGTDGIRGRANLHPMTPEIAMRLGMAVAAHFGREGKIVVGKDTRRSGYMLEMALASGLCALGVDVLLVGPIPTPGIAYLAKSMRADAGVVISASHNSFEDNGFKLFANDGFKIIDLISEGAAREVQLMNRAAFQYFIEFDGMAKLPLLGRVKLKGLTVREAELMLEEQYTRFYNRPFVQLIVSNRRVVVFPGGGGDAKVIPLENSNTTLLEVLATAGGLAKRGNASRVKLFRHGPDGKRLVHQFDLSTIEGLKYADVVMQGDDVIYVEPNPDLAREFLQDLTPIITLLTSVVLVIGIVRGFQ